MYAVANHCGFAVVDIGLSLIAWKADADWLEPIVSVIKTNHDRLS
jgi:hypothetical protein